MKRILIAMLILILMLGVVFAASSSTHSVALAPHAAYTLVADTNDGSGDTTACTDGQTQGCTPGNDGGWGGGSDGDNTDGGWGGGSGDDQSQNNNGGDQTNH